MRGPGPDARLGPGRDWRGWTTTGDDPSARADSLPRRPPGCPGGDLTPHSPHPRRKPNKARHQPATQPVPTTHVPTEGLVNADVVPVHRALVSVYDKTGLVDPARALVEAGVEIVSTGSTAATIAEAGLPVTGG